jgi:hypothetical protein
MMFETTDNRQVFTTRTEITLANCCSLGSRTTCAVSTLGLLIDFIAQSSGNPRETGKGKAEGGAHALRTT